MIKQHKFFAFVFLTSFNILSFNVLMWASPQDAIQNDAVSPFLTTTEVDEEKNENATEEKKEEKIEKKEDEKEKNKEKKDEDESVKAETNGVKNVEKKGEEKSEKNEEKHGENTERMINGEKALDVSAPMFPSKKEIEEKMQKETLSILGVLDILKELDDANLIFNSSKTDIAQLKERDGASLNNASNNASSNNVSAPFKNEHQDENKQLIAQVPNEMQDAHNGETDEVHDEQMEEDEDDNFIIDDFGDDEESSEDESEMPLTKEEGRNSPDEEHFLTFDEEQEIEKGKVALPPKQENMSEKGQLSSVVEEEDDKVNISRYTDIKKGQRIDFSYPGEGWVYLGEENSKKGLNYTKRKMENGKTFFSFKAEEEGNYVLNFSYFDAFSGDFIVDAVSVKILPNKEGTQGDSLVLDYQKTTGKKGEEERKREVAKADASKDSFNQEASNQQDVNAAVSEEKTPQDVPIDSAKVEMKVQDDAKTGDSTSLEKSGDKASEKGNNSLETNIAKQEKKSGEAGSEKKDGADAGKQNGKTSQSKKERKTPPSSKREEVVSPYKEPEVVANVTTLSVTNAGKKGADEKRAKEIIEKADAAISSGDAEVALQNLESFFAIASDDIDRAYLLQGRAYELNGKKKNIKLALQAYKFLTKTFPNSEYRALATERIRYIEKFFVNIK